MGSAVLAPLRRCRVGAGPGPEPDTGRRGGGGRSVDDPRSCAGRGRREDLGSDLAGNDRDNLKLDEVDPLRDPALKQSCVVAFDHLEAPSKVCLDPAAHKCEAVRHEPASLLKPPVDRSRVLVSKPLDHHELHRSPQGGVGRVCHGVAARPRALSGRTGGPGTAWRRAPRGRVEPPGLERSVQRATPKRVASAPLKSLTSPKGEGPTAGTQRPLPAYRSSCASSQSRSGRGGVVTVPPSAPGAIGSASGKP